MAGDARFPLRRVLLTADTIGGVWTYVVELAAGLAEAGIRVDVASMGRRASPGQRAAVRALPGATLHERDYRLEWMEDAWDDVERAGEWLLELDRSIEPDVVHLNQFAFGALPFSAPTVVVAHSCVLSWWRAVHGQPAPAQWARYAQVVGEGLRNADLVVAPTRAMLDTLRENYGFDGPSTVVANGRDAASYRPGAKEGIVFAAGRLWDDAKNLALLEAVAPSLAWPVRVAGSLAAPDGALRPAMHVTHLGELAPDEIAAELARAAIYALPARYEPFGLSIVEAGLSGCALVLGDIPSLREVWGDAAIYVPPDDAQALRSALAMLIEHPEVREGAARRARLRALRYAPERMRDGTLAAYRRVRRAARNSHRLLQRFVPETPACAS